MKGRQILIEALAGAGNAAALIVDGRLEDLVIDAPGATEPLPEAIHLALPSRPMKGVGGLIVELGDGARGFLHTRTPPPPGRPVLVQVSGYAEPGKAVPVSTRLRLKGRTAMLTPGAPGINLSRQIRDEAAGRALREAAERALAGADPSLGLVVRTAAAAGDVGDVEAEMAALRRDWEALSTGTGTGMGGLGLRRAGAGAAVLARRDWRQAGDAVVEAGRPFAETGLWDEIDALARPEVPLGEGMMSIEATRALVAVDVNTGGDLSPAAGLKATLAAMRELPRQLRLRGLGGQVVVDPAPLARARRRDVEGALGAALRGDGIDTQVAGWTPLGHLELTRRRLRRPLPGPEVLEQLAGDA